MKSWWMVAGPGGPALECRDVAQPTPGLGQLRVRVQAASLNRGEFITGQGLLGQLSQPKAMGMEAVVITPQEFADLMRNELVKLRKVVAAARLPLL